MSKENELEISGGSLRHDEDVIQKADARSIDPSKDVGAKYADAANEIEFTAAAERKYLRRVDMILMPIMFLTYGLQYADKSILQSAAQFGIVQDLELSQTVIVDGKPTASLNRYSYAVTMFYWGYVAGNYTREYKFVKL
jgi:hypothetical protein